MKTIREQRAKIADIMHLQHARKLSAKRGASILAHRVYIAAAVLPVHYRRMTCLIVHVGR